MVKKCIRRCTNCGLNGHNNRSCDNKKEKCVKLFGFKIHVPEKHESAMSALDIRKCKSSPDLIDCSHDHGNVGAGYLSDGPPRETRKRGVPWTESEHLSFLSGLKKLGKGNWKGISHNYVQSRTATQVASHAQKYFKRLNLPDKRNRRSSLFDMEITQQADNLPALDEDQNDDGQGQAINYATAAATPLTAPPILPYTPYYGVPNSQMPYIPMVGITGNGQIFPGSKSFPAMPSVPVMYIRNPAYIYLPKSFGSQASNTLLMPAFAHGCSLAMTRP